MKNRIIGIGDIHGNYFTLIDMIKKFDPSDTIILIGDLIDRGMNSSNVIEFVKRQSCKFNNDFDHNFPLILSTKGNHELLFLDFFSDLVNFRSIKYESSLFLQKGGLETINSYTLSGRTSPLSNRIVKIDDLEQSKIFKHLEFIKSLPLYISIPTLINNENRYPVFSHSAIFKVWNLRNSHNQHDNQEFEDHILYGRPKTMTDIKDIYNIFGHTPVPSIDHSNFYANIDTGAFCSDFSHLNQFNKLTAISFPGLEIFETMTNDKDKQFYEKELL